MLIISKAYLVFIFSYFVDTLYDHTKPINMSFGRVAADRKLGKLGEDGWM